MDMSRPERIRGASVRKPTVVKGIGEWRPPVVLYVKFNFDATFNQSLNISSSGIVVRNHRGMSTDLLAISLIS
ncbi:hypothetical protein Golax_014711 [Gossypium laxum]|uniref:Uncharacterized protein n=1 Tax=Gossypium laxum TaxID=34288 RepID=A0A7J8ZVW7_9ROSI|nr:hypothetical protein [Gossypium laxum]